MPFDLRSVTLQNLHGFGHTPTTLDLSRERTVMVGPNNSGKTAGLKILDWLLNEASGEVLHRSRNPRPLTEAEQSVLIPARATGKQARRLTLRIHLSSSADREAYGADTDGTVLLRYDIKSQGGSYTGALQLGAPVRRKADRDRDSMKKAIAVLEGLRQDVLFLHIPSFRDADSDRFRETMRTVYRARLEERALHKKQGRTTEARHLDDAIAKLDEVSKRLVQPLWDDVQSELPPGLARDGAFAFSASRESLLDWLISQLAFRVSTDEHDTDRVGVRNVGAGLQSVLDLALHLAESRNADRSVILAVEEPEAFLHPSAQRTFARQLLRPRPNARLIVTTHSAIVVDEADAADVVLVKSRRFYAPTIAPEQEEIHTAYMRGQGSEAMFARGVLLVEGESDAFFFEALRRRAAAVDSTGALDRLRVVWTSSNTQFGPWVSLFNAYGQKGDRPVQWLAVYDADSGTEARAGLRNAGLTIPQSVVEAIRALNTAKTATMNLVVDPKDPATAVARREAAEVWRQRAREANQAAKQAGLGLRFLPVDLEDAIFERASSATTDQIWQKLGQPTDDRKALLYHLGSKAEQKKSKSNKAPWVRGYAGEVIPKHEIGSDVKAILEAWFAFAMTSESAADFVSQFCTAPAPAP